MIFVLASLLAVTLAGVFSSAVPAAELRAPAPRRRAPTRLVAASTVTIVAGFALWIFAIAAAAHAPDAAANPAWFRSLPLLVIDDRAPRFGHAPYGTFVALACAVQTAGLVGLFLALRGRRTGTLDRRILVVAFVLMAALSMASSCLTSFDLYAYAGAVHRGVRSAYHPSSVPFAADWSVLNRIYGNPIVPSPYGPVWLAVSFAASGWARSLAVALSMLRLLELAAFLVCIVSLRALRVPPAALAVFALNPALFENFVIDGHNDLLGVSFVLAAAALRPRLPLLSILMAGAAGAIKLPLLIVAPLAFTSDPKAKRRFYEAAAAFALGVAISLVFGGSDYIASIRATAAIYRSAISDPSTNLVRTLLALAVACLVVLAVVRRRFIPTASWAFSAIAASIFSWYLAWGIPYAAAQRGWLAAFLISLPWLQFVTATVFAKTSFSVFAFYLTLVLAPTIAALSLRNARPVAL